METVHTRDGAELALRRIGSSGPVLVLVHGGATDSHCFDPLLPHLGDYAVVAYDRRGHGSSTGTATALVELEVEDLRAVIEHVDGALVLGYSYGAMITLRALTTGAPQAIRGAVLYEPPMAVDAMLHGLERVVSLVEQGQHDAAAAAFIKTAFHLSDGVVVAMRRDPRWQVTVDHMPTLPPELRALATAALPQPPLAAPPTRVLVAAHGGNPAFGQIGRHLAAVLPRCDVVEVPGLPHFAMATEPVAFAAAVKDHFANC